MATTEIKMPDLKIAPSLRAQMYAAARPIRLRAGELSGGVVRRDRSASALLSVIISLQPIVGEERGGITASKRQVMNLLAGFGIEGKVTDYYLGALLSAEQIESVSKHPGVEMVWMNNKVEKHLVHSAETVKASAGWRTFEARGKGITWAVLDTGINADHPHFALHGTINRDLSCAFVGPKDNGLTDLDGHGTHVAGIIAGMGSIPSDIAAAAAAELPAPSPTTDPSGLYLPETDDTVARQPQPMEGVPSGLAPAARLVAVRVLDKDGYGEELDCIAGLQYLRKLNQDSNEIVIDGANLSLGYDLHIESYGCGNSPLCEEVNRAVNAGICVVVSCGNSGYGIIKTLASGVESSSPAGITVSITDPANADLCIAVGSVHKKLPHKHGVSYFSSKGPTLDGRRKPDLVAPGEKIISCKADFAGAGAYYCELSGTSMAAPHVSGAIASFLSVRKDYRGNPREVKRIFKEAAQDLGRDPAYQGAGLVDTFKALTSV